MDKKELALKLHGKGYNCAQSVLCAFADELDMDEKDMFRMAEAFGFGMGCMETCGAVSGMVFAAGIKESDGNLDAPATKKARYKASKSMVNAFKEKNQSVICREIKGVDTGTVLRSCNGCIEDAVEILEAYLNGSL